MLIEEGLGKMGGLERRSITCLLYIHVAFSVNLKVHHACLHTLDLVNNQEYMGMCLL